MLLQGNMLQHLLSIPSCKATTLLYPKPVQAPLPVVGTHSFVHVPPGFYSGCRAGLRAENSRAGSSPLCLVLEGVSALDDKRYLVS